MRLYSNVLGEELRVLEKQVVQKWTSKWTSHLLVQGLNEKPLPGRGRKVSFMELPEDALADHTKANVFPQGRDGVI